MGSINVLKFISGYLLDWVGMLLVTIFLRAVLTKALIPFIEKIGQKFNLNKPIVIADAGLLSKDNVKALENNNAALAY